LRSFSFSLEPAGVAVGLMKWGRQTSAENTRLLRIPFFRSDRLLGYFRGQVRLQPFKINTQIFFEEV
jgi:hypothetical protein